MKVGEMNLDDAREHGAQALSFLCPMCNQTLRRVCDAYEMLLEDEEEDEDD